MRKLAAAVFSFAAAVLAVLLFAGTENALLYAVALCVLGLLARLLKGRAKAFASIALISAAVGLVWLWGYTEIFVKPACELADKKVHVTAEAVDYSEITDRGERLTVRINAGGRNIKAIIYSYGSSASGAAPGDVLEFDAKLRSEEIGSNGNNISKGYILTGYVNGTVSVVSRAEKLPLKYVPKYFAKAVKDTLREIFPEDVSPFAEALLTGDKDRLNRDRELYSALRLTGISHVVAVSGMHIAFLMGFIMLILGRRSWAPLAALPVMFVFMAMVGDSPSVVRAGIMQTVVIAAPLVRREYDPVTSLAFALGVIVLQNPYSILNVGLQLSFAATLGIVLIAVPAYDRMRKLLKSSGISEKKTLRRIVTAVCTAFISSMGAIAFTLPLSALHFGYISLIAPVTNLLVFWAISLSFTGTAVACLAGMIFLPAGKLIGLLVSLPIRYVIFVAKRLAGLSIAAVSSSSVPMLIWMIAVYIIGITLALLKTKPRRMVLPCCIAAAAFCAALILSKIPTSDKTMEVTALDIGQGQCIAIESGEYAAVVDCGSSSGENAGRIAASFLASKCRDKIDLLILTHYHKDHVNGISELAELVRIGAILMPEPGPESMEAHDEIIAVAQRRKADIIYVSENLHLTMGDLTAEVYGQPRLYSGDENCLMMTFSQDDFDVLITGDADGQTEKRLIAQAALPDVELLIAGHHGSKYSSCPELLSAVMPEAAVISAGENSYGHPAAETLNRLAEYGADIYRTDIDGNIPFRAE